MVMPLCGLLEVLVFVQVFVVYMVRLGIILHRTGWDIEHRYYPEQPHTESESVPLKTNIPQIILGTFLESLGACSWSSMVQTGRARIRISQGTQL